MFGKENGVREFKVVYDDAEMFTVYWCGKQIAWSQWSPLYSLWRVLICDTGQLHHVTEQKDVFDVCAAWIGFGAVDKVEIEA
jgi:hypothetical protein